MTIFVDFTDAKVVITAVTSKLLCQINAYGGQKVFKNVLMEQIIFAR